MYLFPLNSKRGLLNIVVYHAILYYSSLLGNILDCFNKPRRCAYVNHYIVLLCYSMTVQLNSDIRLLHFYRFFIFPFVPLDAAF